MKDYYMDGHGHRYPVIFRVKTTAGENGHMERREMERQITAVLLPGGNDMPRRGRKAGEESRQRPFMPENP